MSSRSSTRSAAIPGPFPLVTAGEFHRIHDPAAGETEPWCINDHCLIQGPDGLWHLFGITHIEPFTFSDDPARNLAHATAERLTQSPWVKHPFALTADPAWKEVHLWAPHVIRVDGLYYMFVCVGDEDHSRYKIHLLTSPDLRDWTRHPENPMVVDGYDARDPCVVRVGDEWAMYYTATSAPEGGNHIVACQTSRDLIHWSGRRVVYVDPETGTFGGPTESPFVVQRGGLFYLFICNNDRRERYRHTDVYVSRDPFRWNYESDLAGAIEGHACEVVQDTDGRWYVSHCGWFQKGVWLAELTWNDGGGNR